MMHDKIWNLLAKKMADQLPPEEETELERLLQQHPDASYIKEVLMQPWKDKHKPFTPEETELALQRHQERLQAAMEHEEEEPEPETGRVRRMILRISGVAAALALAFYIGYAVWPQRRVSAEAALQQMVTRQGSRSQIKLPDGTSVWLNAGSQLDYPKQFTGQYREVTLLGEAFFDVAQDAEHPFIVKTKTFSIRVLGTTFNVRAYPQEENAVTSLVSGVVEVVMDKNTVRLMPNEKLSISTLQTMSSGEAAENAGSISAAAPVVKSTLTEVTDSVMAETAWVQNKLAFKKQPLEKVAVMLEQWYGADIRFKDEAKKQLYFSGVFEEEDLSDVLRALELTGSFHFKKDAEGVIWIE
ncbi:FecR domain-containing protein [Chitinophaga sp. YIM B06452]|uniref:FecR family protein n=1 Tax=Chitinophaga sp. YIM B06452 TaxID=3082158 RepID=UPI0031FE7858